MIVCFAQILARDLVSRPDVDISVTDFQSLLACLVFVSVISSCSKVWKQLSPVLNHEIFSRLAV